MYAKFGFIAFNIFRKIISMPIQRLVQCTLLRYLSCSE